MSKGEIDKDFYCSGGFKLNDKGCRIFSRLNCDKDHCRQRHRKHPTPEQFKEEYGEEYPDEGAVYAFDEEKCEWRINTYFAAKHCNLLAVCACTPWGKPDKKWRPE
jgi:hypothetical protein